MLSVIYIEYIGLLVILVAPLVCKKGVGK